ncbi:D-methionine transport system permease protein [Geosporobacter subterraneus DSM 17957]|uniref:D-methionine transport system permease protein n=1 Tax=Geosporobacter subterraneus DSM 17957 TaxID=1121919 RepID=A0A1M6L907_9FIRM|nr:methionine ABC transporter permease [Geosporobacter subterraneus]SHJ67634.1 D-methionine transport system permease protein [Geosporobacter subterraneus DSM 17957]
MNSFSELVALLTPSLFETLYMVFASILFTILFGLPLGVILVITNQDHILPNPFLNNILSYAINTMRSLPFIILMIFIIPFTRMIVGTSIGTTAAIVPLVVAATPFFARIVESALREVDWGVVEAAIAMGATPMQIILRVLIPEAMSSLVLGITITLINIISFSAMAGVVGGGGLGDLAVRYGYHRFQTDVMLATVVVLIILVQFIQTAGNRIAKNINKK